MLITNILKFEDKFISLKYKLIIININSNYELIKFINN